VLLSSTIKIPATSELPIVKYFALFNTFANFENTAKSVFLKQI